MATYLIMSLPLINIVTACWLVHAETIHNPCKRNYHLHLSPRLNSFGQSHELAYVSTP